MSARNFVKVRGELADGRKVFRVADELDCSRDEALGLLVRWLLWVDAHCDTPDTGLDWTQVDELLGQECVFRALEAIGWVEQSEGTVRVLEYEKYLSPTAKVRQATAARVAACKARKRAAAAGVEVPAGLEAKKGGTRLRDNGQAETTSTRKGGKKK